MKSDAFIDENQLSNVTMLMTRTMGWTLGCKMSFAAYPVDYQVHYYYIKKISYWTKVRSKKSKSLQCLKMCQNDIFSTNQRELKLDLLASNTLVDFGSKNVQLLSEKIGYQLDSSNLDYEVIVSLKRSDRVGLLDLEIKLNRKLMRSLIEVISPPAFLVQLSWVSPKPHKQKRTQGDYK